MLSAVTVEQAPAPLVSVGLLRRHGRIDAGNDDDLLKLYAQAAVEAAEVFLARALVTQTLKWVLMESPSPSFAMSQPGLMNYPGNWAGFPHLLQRPLLLPRSPVKEVTRVALGDPLGGPDTVLDPAAWVADVDLQPSRLRIDGSWMAGPMRHIEVTFIAGYGTPEQVPAPIRLGVLMTALWLYENRGDGEGTMPEAAERLMWPYRMISLGS